MMMQAARYTRYFFFLSINWNIRIAFHIILREIRGEKKYGIQTTGADELASMEKKGIDISHATIYMPASYDLLEILFKQLEPLQLKHFLDIGCGKGRALCVAANHQVPTVTGIDFSKELCQQATINLEKTIKKNPSLQYKIVNNDAFYYEIPDDVDCIFLFNPFDEIIMKGVLENINKSLKRSPRGLHIVYLNPLYKDLFTGKGFKEVFYTKRMHYLEASILQKNAR
jgi:SAM-dependent methyltransferase